MLDLVPRRGLTEHIVVNRLVLGIQYPDCQMIDIARFEGVSHVQLEWALAAFMPANRLTIEPNVGPIIHRPKPEQPSTGGVRILGSVEIPLKSRDSRNRMLGVCFPWT